MRSCSVWVSATILIVGCGDNLPPPGLDRRPRNETCIAPPRPAQLVTLDPAFDAIFSRPVQMQMSPDGAWWYVAELGGRVWRMSADGRSITLALDITSQVNSSIESGLLGMALHPDFTTTGDLFVSITAYGGTVVMSRVLRFHSSDGGATFDPGSEQPILEVDQVTKRHHNADLQFGPDGYLYIGFGDGGPQGDPNGRAQDPFQLKGKILRIDVDSGTPYTIPADNPFAAGGAAPEIWAMGFRNPWRFTFDRSTGELWAGDVGGGKRDEIDLVVAGGNYGWPLREGSVCQLAEPCDLPGAIDPVVESPHQGGNSIVAGYVYRGTSMPSLVGQLLYADFVTGEVFAIDPLSRSPVPQLLNASGHNVVSFAQDLDGELYAIDLQQGSILRLVPGTDGPTDVPQLLSDTGCFREAGEPTAGLIPYELNVPFWSDGADKQRWMALPDGETIALDGDDLVFPVGSVLAKEFRLGDERIETRLLVRHDDGEWAGYTYQWNTTQTDAALIASSGLPTMATWDEQVWSYPRRTDCLTCHTAATGRTIGLELTQLERSATFANGTADQLATLERIGMFSSALPDVRAMPATDGNAPLADRARAWLHANCAYCHQPGGPGRGAFDLRFSTPFAETNLCDVPPTDGELEIVDARRIAPGDPGRSVLSARIRSLGVGRMPPLARSIIDTSGADLVDAWIGSLRGCE